MSSTQSVQSSSQDGVCYEGGVINGLFHNTISCRIQKIGRRYSPLTVLATLSLICVLSLIIRQFSVIRYESVIHEFDPYFNFRTSRYLSSEGFYEFWNWFDDDSWYPLGRVIGQTLYPGLMTTATLLHSFLHFFGFIIDIKDVCVFTAPIFSAFTAIATFLFTKEVTGQSGAGLFAALFVGISPSYMSRSVAGSYDNEGIAIFTLVLSFYVFVKAVTSGTMLWAMFASLAFFYMVTAWGGYVFILNTITIYMTAMTLLNKLTLRHHVGYCVFYVLSTTLALNVPFVNFSAVTSSEHMSSHGVFIMLNAILLGTYLRRLLPKDPTKFIFKLVVGVSVVSFFIFFLWMKITGRTYWSGRSMTLLDPTYAAKHIPIIASVSEHQPTIWTSYVFDLHLCTFLAPVGLWICFKRASDGLMFAGIYGILAVYFSGVMVRLMLVLAPAAAILSGIGLSFVVSTFVGYIRLPTALFRATCRAIKKTRKQAEGSAIRLPLAVIVIAILMYICSLYVQHATWVSSVAYSSPSIILNRRLRDGSRLIQDDFREAYYWLRKNTHPKARVMSWWDYGYQATAMGNRTIIVDNNTWNNTHIATVGLALASNEEDAYPIIKKLDVDYVFVVFGGAAGYPSDDLNKFVWMIRIASGVYPRIQLSDYLNAHGGYSTGPDASPTMVNSLMYKLSYYRFARVGHGIDYARNFRVSNADITLKQFEEVYTTDNWLVRIYKVKKSPNRGAKVKTRYPLKVA